MPPPHRVDPVHALYLLAAHMNPIAPRLTAVHAAGPAAYLAEDLALPAVPEQDRDPIAARNGYALPGAVRPGDVLSVAGVAAAGGLLDPHGAPLSSEDPPGPADADRDRGVWRVEAGARMPRGCDRVLPVGSAVLLGPARIRVEEEVERGAGVLARPEGSPSQSLRAGHPLRGRTSSLLAALGVESVAVRPPFTVALAGVGDELVSSAAQPAAASIRSRDTTSRWLAESIAALGLRPLPIGPIPDSPAAIRDVILHVRGRADVLCFLGGVGDGVTDRTIEGIRRFEAHILFDGLAAAGDPALFFAKTLGIDIVGVPGKPLETALAFDLFVRPALLARLGAAQDLWDWSRTRWAIEEETPSAPEAGPDPSRAQIRPAALVPGPEGDPRIRRLPPGDPFLPLVPGQTGWAVIPASSAPCPARAHYQAAEA